MVGTKIFLKQKIPRTLQMVNLTPFKQSQKEVEGRGGGCCMPPNRYRYILANWPNGRRQDTMQHKRIFLWRSPGGNTWSLEPSTSLPLFPSLLLPLSLSSSLSLALLSIWIWNLYVAHLLATFYGQIEGRVFNSTHFKSVEPKSRRLWLIYEFVATTLLQCTVCGMQL